MMQHNLAQTFGLYTQYIMRLLTFRGMCIYIYSHTHTITATDLYHYTIFEQDYKLRYTIN